MPTYRLGSKGPEVERLQERLKALQHYIGPLDGIFGGGTQSAVKSFQRQNGLSADGIVGPVTWRHLFPDEEIHAPAIHNKPLAYRSLALTGAFETGAGIPDCFAGLSGDFDDQGLSFGVLQWNLGQGSLQPLLKRMDETHSEILREIFDERYPELLAMLRSDRDEQLDWARSMQDQRQRLTEPWLGLFKTLGRWEAFQNIQVEAADRLYLSHASGGVLLQYLLGMHLGQGTPMLKSQSKEGDRREAGLHRSQTFLPAISLAP